MNKNKYILLLSVLLSFHSIFGQLVIQENTTGFCSVDGVIITSSSTVTGFTGTGYADGDIGLGKSANWSVSVPAIGTVSVSWRYANGGGLVDRAVQLLVDGIVVQDISFPHTGNWSTWQMTSAVDLTLTPGNHNIRLIALSSSGLANLDYLQASGNSVAAAGCVPSYSITVNKNIDAGGTIWYEPVQPFYDERTLITVHAQANPGYFLQSWTGEYPSTDADHTFAIKKNTVATALFLPNGTTMDPDIIGYATVQDDAGTPYLVTGGQGGQTVQAMNLSELKNYLGSAEPLIVELGTTITGAEVVSMKSNKTLIGINDNAHLVGIQLDINNGTRNVIVQNVKISHVVAAAGIGDAISINGKAKNIWIDHCDLFADRDHDKDYYDGLLDIKNEASFITVSWCKFHDHYKVALAASNDQSPLDSALRITFHHNYFYNCGSRLPSIRYGKAHLFNNYYKDSEDAVSSRMNACIRIEENYFENIGTAVMANQSIELGKVHILDNHFGSASVATSPTCVLQIPYQYNSVLQDKNEVPGIVTSIGSKDMANTIFVSHYPNPSNSALTIEYSSKKSSDVRIELYDISGKRMEVFSNHSISPGLNKICLDFEKYPAGVYLYKFISGEEMVTNKIIIAR